MFENVPPKGPEYLHRNLEIARFLVAAVRIFIGGLLSWLVSSLGSVPELTCHGVGRGLHVYPQREGCCKSVVWSVCLFGESVHWSCVCFKLFMPNSLNVSGRGGNVALNSLLMSSLSLKLSLSCRALKQLEMAKLRVSFWWTWIFLC